MIPFEEETKKEVKKKIKETRQLIERLNKIHPSIKKLNEYNELGFSIGKYESFLCILKAAISVLDTKAPMSQ